jgi:arabinose-5-phosphate isomerase
VQEKPAIIVAQESLRLSGSVLTQIADDRLTDVLQVGSAVAWGRGKILLTGVGKAGTVARGIAELFAASGTPAHFLHPTEAMHGDLGVISSGDDVLVVSWSGATSELLKLMPHLKRRGARVTALVGSSDTPLARSADMVLAAEMASIQQPGSLPTTSTLVLLALGHALVLTVFEVKSYSSDIILDLHPATWITPHRDILDNL